MQFLKKFFESRRASRPLQGEGSGETASEMLTSGDEGAAKLEIADLERQVASMKQQADIAEDEANIAAADRRIAEAEQKTAEVARARKELDDLTGTDAVPDNVIPLRTDAEEGDQETREAA